MLKIILNFSNFRMKKLSRKILLFNNGDRKFIVNKLFARK